MHEENTVSLKIYLKEGNINTEVRRFEVDQAVITNYDYMRERLQMAIPKLRGKVYKLLWQDSDGDEVTISSDEELMIALSEFKSNICKFIVRLPSEEQEPEAHISINFPNMHDMFTSISSISNTCPLFAELQGDQNCHACQQPITGFRYRCLECVQYYQCGDCEHKKVHPDHIMLRISKNPSLATLIPKCMQILKSHFIQGTRCAGMNAGAYFREKMSHCHKEEKDKRGHHHHRRFRKHGYAEKNSAQTDESSGECPFNEQILNNLGNVISAFLGGASKDGQTSKQPETASASTTNNSAPIKTVDIDAGPPMPSNIEDARMEEDPVIPSTSSAQSQKDTKIKMAVDLLSEMGFNNENQWLSNLLDHFDGDIAKTIDHLTLKK